MILFVVIGEERLNEKNEKKMIQKKLLIQQNFEIVVNNLESKHELKDMKNIYFKNKYLILLCS